MINALSRFVYVKLITLNIQVSQNPYVFFLAVKIVHLKAKRNIFLAFAGCIFTTGVNSQLKISPMILYEVRLVV